LAKRPVDAEREYRKAIELQPDSWSNHNYLAAFLNGQQRYAEAEKQFLAALDRFPENARVLANLGGLYANLERWDDAEQVLNRAIRFNPDSGAALSNLGSVLIGRNEDYAGAAALYARAANATPRDYRVWYNLGFAQYWSPALRPQAPASYTRAASLIEEELTVRPTDPRLLMWLADCRSIAGPIDLARPLVARALRNAPGAVDLRIAATVSDRLGDRAAALRFLGLALDAGLDPAGLAHVPSLADLRKDARYAALLDKARTKLKTAPTR